MLIISISGFEISSFQLEVKYLYPKSFFALLAKSSFISQIVWRNGSKVSEPKNCL